MIFWIAPLLPWLRDRADEFVDFLRSIPPLFAPKPTTLSPTYVPPFTGGQCPVNYDVTYQIYRTDLEGNEYTAGASTLQFLGAIGTIRVVKGTMTPSNGLVSISFSLETGAGLRGLSATNSPNGTGISNGRGVVLSVSRSDGQPDNCGNLNNPNPPPSIADDGLFSPSNPPIGDDNGNLNPSAIVLAPFIPPLAILPFVIGAYNAAIDAAKAATDVFNKIDKIVDILDTLDNLLDKLNKDSDDKKKDDPKNRTIVRQTYGQILGDGALDFFPNNNTKFQAIQLDVVITNIPIGFGRYFGSLSPSRYRFRELGYIAFYSVNQGILSIHSIQFKRTSYQIPELAVGFIYHLGLDEQIKGFAFGTFSVEKT